MEVIPFTLYSQKNLNYIDSVLDIKFNQWLQNVFGAIETESEMVRDFFACSSEIKLEWAENRHEDKKSVLVSERNIQIRLTGTAQFLSLISEGDLKEDELNYISQILVLRLLNALKEEQNRQLPYDALANPYVKGSGALYKRYAVSGITVEILIYGGLLLPEINVSERKRWSDKPRQSLAQRTTAVKEANVKLSATLGGIEISIGELNKIAPGDIVKFDQLFTEAVNLINDAGEYVCSAKLGEKDNHRAVMIVK